jgi:ADP-ribose pyrophosphatase YjhB (NUDIX family)
MKKRIAAFAYAILRGDEVRREVLAVRRSPNDRYFPGLLGLPAGTLRKRERYEEAVRRTARRNFGVEAEVLGERGSGASDRGTHIVEMTLFEARLIAGEPRVPAADPDGFGYAEVRWAAIDLLKPALERGSLCCRLLDEWLLRP